MSDHQRDWIQETVERVHKPPAGWRWRRSEVMGDPRPNDGERYFLVEGGIPRVLTRGPRKGDRTWDKSKLTKYVITKTQIDASK